MFGCKCTACAVPHAGWMLVMVQISPGRAEPGEVLRTEVNFRQRYESLQGQFRAGGEGGDQLFALRTLIKVDAGPEPLRLVVEVQDSRTYLDDAGTPLSGSFVDVVEPVQAYVRYGFDDLLGAAGRLQVGRMTVDIGSRRNIERNGFRNTTDSFTGLDLQARWATGWHLRAAALIPVEIRPDDRQALDGNEWAINRETQERRIGVLLLAKEGLAWDLRAEGYLFARHESQRIDRPNLARRLAVPGLRLTRAAEPGRLYGEFEVNARLGSQLPERGLPETRRQRVRAHMLHATLGYSFQAAWRPRLEFNLDLASGDDDPSDNQIGTYERIVGTRRGDLNNTSIMGPLTRQNLIAPGARALFDTGRFDGRLLYKAAFQASPTDEFRQADLIDPTGESGRFIGHLLDGRVRAWLIDDRVRGVLGGTVLFKGRFAEEAPGAPDTGDTLYGYVQLETRF